jgi:ABC-type antimicrobial peptide transport system permease subunit
VRTLELGSRLALGAEPSSLLRLVLVEGVRLAAAGLVVGLAGALLSGRLVASLLFGVEPTDAVSVGGAGALLAVGAVAAAVVPALRASRVEPVVALRAD